MKLRELELEIKTELEAAGLEDPAYEARQILSSILNLNSADLLTREHQDLEADSLKTARHWTFERARGIPLAYLSGKKGFYKHEFIVEPGVLVPRPESEIVVEVALARARERGLHVLNIADLGSGSGILGLSLLAEIPAAELIAVDISPTAARVTSRNAEALNLKDKMKMIEQPVEKFKPPHGFELVVANPPYIATNDPNVQQSVRDHEPHDALFAADNGFAAIESWGAWAMKNLLPGGIFVCEIGTGQSAKAQDIMSKLGFSEIRVTNDLAGHDRVVSAVRG